MKSTLTDRQTEILEMLRNKYGDKNKTSFDNLKGARLSVQDIDIICGVINEEFMMEGILPNFEPNDYGVELEGLLDAINRSRIQPN